MPPVINHERCIQCGKCVEICTEDVFFGSGQEEVPKVTYPEECWHCKACVEACPEEGSIRLRIPLPMMVCYK